MVPVLIQPVELAEQLRSRPPAILDVRWRLGGPPGRAQHLAGHVPGAAFVDLDRDLAAPPGPGRHPLPGRDQFSAAMRAAGVAAGRPVVVYDAADSTAAARAWWLLRHFGHEDVRILDGGFAAWRHAGLPVESGAVSVTPGDFRAGPGRLPTVDAGGVPAVVREGVLLDVRAAERYRGEVEPVDPVAGHIPGAASLPTAGNVGPGGRFLTPAQLRRRFEDAGVRSDRIVGVYCGSGVTACHTLAALSAAGFEGVLYPGSWSEWISDSSRPVEQGVK